MRAWIYDSTVRLLTLRWYREVLLRVPNGARLLDVGIGTGGALASNAALLREKDLHVVGVDIDADYVRRARIRMKDNNLDDRVEVLFEGVQNHARTGYDAVYFSASFMILPDPAGVLRHVQKLLAPRGRIYFTQTFQDKRSPFVEQMKPLLKQVTTIDFGQVTYEEDFLAVVDGAGVDLVELTTLSRNRARSSRLAVGRPREQATA